jgi:membrane protease YdiL (CAAX protease family)
MLEQLIRRRAIYAAEPARGWLAWGILVPVLGIAFVIATVISLQVLLQHNHLLDSHENPVGLTGFVAFLLLPFGALGLVVLAWVRFVERRPLAGIGLARGIAMSAFIRSHLTGVAMASAIVAGIWLSGAYTAGPLVPAFHSAGALGAIAILLLCFGLQSSVEELLFRGWMLSTISLKFGVVAAVIISSAVFDLLHFDPGSGWIFGINVFLFAVFACCWCLRSGNVWGAMGWHAGWNWMFATGFELRVTGLDAHEPALLVRLIQHGPVYLTGGAEGPEASCVTTILLAGAIAFLAWRGPRGTA